MEARVIHEMPKPGSMVMVRWGRDGEQLARVMRVHSAKRVVVKKYRLNSHRWTKPQVTLLEYVLRYANDTELRRIK